MLGVSSDQLLGDQRPASPPSLAHDPHLNEGERSLLEVYRTLDPHGRDVVQLLVREEARRVSSAAEPALHKDVIFYTLPAAAGVPMWADDDSYERIEFPASPIPLGADFAIRISGNSMEPTIPSGSIVFVRKTSELRPGEIGILLKSDNPTYDALIIQGHQRFTITGKVLGDT